MVILVGAGQAGDSPVFEHLLAHLEVRRVHRGRPRTRPDRVRGDKAYSSRANRALLRRRRIAAVIPEATPGGPITGKTASQVVPSMANGWSHPHSKTGSEVVPSAWQLTLGSRRQATS